MVCNVSQKLWLIDWWVRKQEDTYKWTIRQSNNQSNSQLSIKQWTKLVEWLMNHLNQNDDKQLHDAVWRQSTYGHVHQQIHRTTHWSIHWSSRWLLDCLFDWSIEWRHVEIDWSIDWRFDRCSSMIWFGAVLVNIGSWSGTETPSSSTSELKRWSNDPGNVEFRDRTITVKCCV